MLSNFVIIGIPRRRGDYHPSRSDLRSICGWKGSPRWFPRPCHILTAINIEAFHGGSRWRRDHRLSMIKPPVGTSRADSHDVFKNRQYLHVGYLAFRRLDVDSNGMTSGSWIIDDAALGAGYHGIPAILTYFVTCVKNGIFMPSRRFPDDVSTERGLSVGDKIFRASTRRWLAATWACIDV